MRASTIKRSIRTLPIVEPWDCHGCGHCCRGTVIPLDKDDLQKLAEQRWQEHPDFQGVRTVVRESLLGGRRVLAKRPDGRCVFLNADGRCRIHELHGAEAKPAVCRMFPFQVVPLGNFAYLTPRRSCPSAAADDGRPAGEHIAALKKAGLIDRFSPGRTRPPVIARGVRRSWPEFLAAADVLARLMTAPDFPLVRRVVHGLRFCELLGQCKLRRVKQESWQELMQILESSSTDKAAEFFRDRQPPSRSTGVLFRQLGVHYVRSHLAFATSGRWRERWRLLRASAVFAHGKGRVPALVPEFPETTFEELERPLGPLSDEVAQPLSRFYETHATSKQYAIVVGRHSLVASFRALALTYPLALWLLRLVIGHREPALEDVIGVVVAMERGQGMSGLTRAANTMADAEQLERLVAWYAR